MVLKTSIEFFDDYVLEFLGITSFTKQEEIRQSLTEHLTEFLLKRDFVQNVKEFESKMSEPLRKDVLCGNWSLRSIPSNCSPSPEL